VIIVNEKTFEKLISQGESENVELKPSLSDTDRIVEVVASLANTHGWAVLIGVNRQGNVLGVTIGKQTIERLTNTITDNIDPVIYPTISVYNLRGKEVIVLEVKENLNKPHLAFGKAFKRVGDVTKLMKRDEYKRLQLQRSKDKLQFDYQIREDATITDIDLPR